MTGSLLTLGEPLGPAGSKARRPGLDTKVLLPPRGPHDTRGVEGQGSGGTHKGLCPGLHRHWGGMDSNLS